MTTETTERKVYFMSAIRRTQTGMAALACQHGRHAELLKARAEGYTHVAMATSKDTPIETAIAKAWKGGGLHYELALAQRTREAEKAAEAAAESARREEAFRPYGDALDAEVKKMKGVQAEMTRAVRADIKPEDNPPAAGMRYGNFFYCKGVISHYATGYALSLAPPNANKQERLRYIWLLRKSQADFSFTDPKCLTRETSALTRCILVALVGRDAATLLTLCATPAGYEPTGDLHTHTDAREKLDAERAAGGWGDDRLGEREAHRLYTERMAREQTAADNCPCSLEDPQPVKPGFSLCAECLEVASANGLDTEDWRTA